MFELATSDIRGVLQDVLAWTICLAALIWGAAPERLVAITWLLLFELGGNFYRFVFERGTQVTQVDYFYASSDMLAGMILIVIALYANRNYTLWIAGMQVLAMTAHLARGLAEMISPVAYLTMVIAPGWLQLLFLALGLSRHVLRERKYGDYRDWRMARNLSDFEAIDVEKGWIASLFSSRSRPASDDQ